MVNAVRQPQAFLTFNRVAIGESSAKPEQNLTLAIRTDANYALSLLQANIEQWSFDQQDVGADQSALKVRLNDVIDHAYAKWGEAVVQTLVENVDYSQYKLGNDQQKSVDVHLHSSKALSQQVQSIARDYIQETSDVPALYISMDEMIVGHGADTVDVGFSRCFSTDGKVQGSYVGRPGRPGLDQQLESLKNRVQSQFEAIGEKVPLVFLEDNVRHAKTMNWIIGEMDTAGIFDYADVAAISTCFCCASEAEQAKIVQGDHIVPVLSVVQYNGVVADVITPRDLLFDGFVVETNGTLGRLPGLFMDAEKLFKIRPERVADFKDDVAAACTRFCDDIEASTGYKVSVSDLTAGRAMRDVLGCHSKDLVKDVVTSYMAEQRAPVLVKEKDVSTAPWPHYN